MQKCENNERMIQPAIHSALERAAAVAEEHTNRLFAVLFEPTDKDNRTAHKTVLESVRQKGFMRILVEVETMQHFPYILDTGV